MRTNLLFAVATVLLAGGAFYFIYSKDAEAPTELPPSLSLTYEGAHLAFSYTPAYYLLEREAGTPSRPQTAIVLVEDTAENRDLLNGVSTEVREGPTAITIDIYENPDSLKAEEWAQQDTNWNIGNKQTEPAAVGGEAGVSYLWDGLYAGKSTIVTRGNKAYVFSVTWMTAEDPIRADFESLLRTVRFK